MGKVKLIRDDGGCFTVSLSIEGGGGMNVDL